MDPASPNSTDEGDAGRPRRSSAYGALTLMIGTLASRITGLLRASILTQFFPASISDAFLTAFKVPNLFRELLAEGALTNSFIPVYRRLAGEERRSLGGALLGLLALVNGLLMLLAFLAAPFLARLLISDPEIVDVDLTTTLIRVVFPFLPAISFSALAMGILNAEERFAAPAWAPVMLNVVTVVLMALYPGQAIVLTLAHVLGGLAQLLVQLPALARYRLLPNFGSLWHPALGGVLLLIVPFAFTTGGRQLLNVLASRLVTGLFEGAQNAFANADLFLSMMLGLFSISPALAYYSRLSAHAAEAPEEFGATLTEGLRLIAFLTIPAGLALAVLAGPAVQLAFNWKVLLGPPLDDARLLGSIAATAPLGLAVFPIGMFNLLIRTFYIRGRVRTPVLIVLGTLTVQGTLYLLLVGPLGLAGLSWGAAVAAWIQLLVTVGLVRRSEGLPLRPLAAGVVRMWVAALVAAAVTLWALSWAASLPSWSVLYPSASAGLPSFPPPGGGFGTPSGQEGVLPVVRPPPSLAGAWLVQGSILFLGATLFGTVYAIVGRLLGLSEVTAMLDRLLMRRTRPRS